MGGLSTGGEGKTGAHQGNEVELTTVVNKIPHCLGLDGRCTC